MESFERSLLEKNLDKSKTEKIFEPEVQVEKGEEKDFYSILRKELKEMQKGGVDIHFAQIDMDRLSKRALDMYEEYKKHRSTFEKDLAEFRKGTAEGSDDYNFSAMILNWHMHYVSDKRRKEKEERSKLKLAA